MHHPEGGCLRKGVWSGADDLPLAHSSLLACGEPPGTRWVRCQPRSPTSCCWPWMRPRPTQSCTGRTVATRSRWPSGFGTAWSRPACLTTAQPSHRDPCRAPTGAAAEAGGCGCFAVWSMRSAWSASRVARGSRSADESGRGTRSLGWAGILDSSRGQLRSSADRQNPPQGPRADRGVVRGQRP